MGEGVGEGGGGDGAGEREPLSPGAKGPLWLLEGWVSGCLSRLGPELVQEGPRVSGEASGVHRAEIPGVGGLLSCLPEALGRWVVVHPHDDDAVLSRV